MPFTSRQRTSAALMHLFCGNGRSTRFFEGYALQQVIARRKGGWETWMGNTYGNGNGKPVQDSDPRKAIDESKRGRPRTGYHGVTDPSILHTTLASTYTRIRCQPGRKPLNSSTTLSILGVVL